MRSVSGHVPHPPRHLVSATTSVAERLGRDVVSNDLWLIGLTEIDVTPARQVLEAEGLTTSSLMDAVRTEGDHPLEEPTGQTFPPAFNGMLGRAQAFAATLGDGTITPEHVMLGLIWDPTDQASQLIWKLGRSRERIVEGLAAHGVAVPGTSIPPQHEKDVGDQVWFDREDLRRVMDHFRKHVPPDVEWGFNYEGDRAWVMAETKVDAERLVAEAIRGDPVS